MYREKRLRARFMWTLVLVPIFVFCSFAQQVRRTAEFELAPLVKGLSSSNPDTVRDSAFRLSQLSPAARVLLPAEASTVLERLTAALSPAQPADVRRAAAYGLGSITAYLRGRITGVEREQALLMLSKAADASNPDALRAASAWATSNLIRITGARISPELRTRFLDDLTNLLDSATPGVPAAAADALGAVFRNAEGPGASSYKEQAEAAVRSLVSTLAASKEPSAKISAIDALASVHYQSADLTEVLTRALATNPNVEIRIASARVLGELGSGEQISGPVLASALLDPNETLQIAAASALAFLGAKCARLPHVVEYLGIALQQDDNPKLQETVAWTVGRMGVEAASEADDLMRALESEAPDVRKNAAWALGQVIRIDKVSSARDFNRTVSEADKVSRRLTRALRDSDADVRSEAANALAVLSAKAERGDAFKLIPALQEGRDDVAEAVSADGNLAGDPGSEQALRTMDDSIAALRGRSFRRRFLSWANNRWVIGGTAVVILYLLWFAILRFAVLIRRPLLILEWNEALESSQSLKLPSVLSNINIPIRHALLVGFYRFHGRVLDAWVESHCSAARDTFLSRSPCKERSVWIPLPVIFEEDPVPELTPAHLLPVTTKKCWRLRIIGEGGSGKTALACQLALWGVHETTEKRLSHELMLPVVLGPNSSASIRKDLTALTEAIRRELQLIISSTEPISKSLLDKLLRKKRVLVVLDGVSEMSHEPGVSSQEWETLDDPDFPVNALIVTSRLQDSLVSGPNTDIAPVRIDTDHLLPFMNVYLRKAGLRLDDVTLYESCRRLAAMVGSDRGITPLMARLYAQHIASATPFTDQSVRQFPRNLPELVLAYLNDLNQRKQQDEPDNPTLHSLAKIAAWECLRRHFRPSSTLRANLLAAFEAEGFGKAQLEFLEHSVGLIKVIAPEYKEIYFVLDSVADYLGAMRAAELCQSDEDWRTLLAQCKAAPGFPHGVKGFVVALVDYCAAKQSTVRIPSFAREEMAEMMATFEERPKEFDSPKTAAAGI